MKFSSLPKNNFIKKIYCFILLGLFSTQLVAFQNIDTVSNYNGLKFYSGSEDTVYIDHERYFGFFARDTCTIEDHGTKIITISGCWKRIHNNFSPRFWALGGQSNDQQIGPVLKEIDAINCAAIAASNVGGDTIEIDSMYIIDRPVFLISNNTYLGTSDSCGFKRMDPPITILTDTAKVNDPKIFVVDNYGFRTFHKINIANGLAFDSIAGHIPYTASVSQSLGGDTTIFLSGLKIQKTMLPGDSVSLFFNMMNPRFSHLDSIHLKNLVFDGNFDNYALNYDWRSNKTIQIPTTSYSCIEQCRFYNIPAENIFICGAVFKDCSGSNLNGSIVHLSCNSFDRPTEVLYNNFTNTNLIGNTLMKHSEAGFTFSAKVQNLRLAYNEVRNIGEHGVGIFRNDDSSNEITDNLLNTQLETISFQLEYLYPETNLIYNNKNLLNTLDTSSQSCWLNQPLLTDSFPCMGNSSWNQPLDIGDTITITIDSILLRKSNENFVKSIAPIYDEAFFNLINIGISSPNLSQNHKWVYVDTFSIQKKIIFDNGHRDGPFSQGNWGYEGCNKKGNCTNISFTFEVTELPESIQAVDCPLKGFQIKFDGETANWNYPIYCQNDPILFENTILGMPILNSATVTSNQPQKNLRKINIFPNPSSDYITFEPLTTKNTTFQLINLLGDIVLSGKLEQSQLQIGHLTEGLYILKISSKTKNYFGSFIKTRH